MIYVTGDMHCTGEIWRIDNCDALKTATKDDYLIVCGDFGFVWHTGDEDKFILDQLDAKPFTTLFVDGNHENFEALYRYLQETWHGGQIHKIQPSIFHLMRGEVFDIDGKRFFTMGGASSTDKQWRIDRVSWWQEELSNYIEYRHAMEILDAHDWNVDYVLTHATLTSVMKQLCYSYIADSLTDFLEEISHRLSFKHWYFGHYHENSDIGKEYSCLYENIIALRNEKMIDG